MAVGGVPDLLPCVDHDLVQAQVDLVLGPEERAEVLHLYKLDPIYGLLLTLLALCIGTWFMIERTKLGSYLRAGTENPALAHSFGINVPLMLTLTYAAGAGLAVIAGVLAVPVIQVTPLMGSNLIIIVFAVVIGGMGSTLTGLALGLIEGLTKVFYPEASSIVVFVIMAIVLLIRPAGLFGKEK